MTSVTERINSIKQPYGGYIKPSEFQTKDLNDGIILNEEENVSATVVGMAVDYMTRFMLNKDKDNAFRISLKGANTAVELGYKSAISDAKKLLNDINGIDDRSIINACKIVTFDVWYRNPVAAFMATGFKDTNPDKATIDNIRILINRSLEFFKMYGPITKEGFTFEPVKSDERVYQEMILTGKGSYGGYTATVNTGDGDFLTADTLWDFKVSKSKPTNKHTLQLLMYWVMGQHSGQKVFKDITKLGIFNPRLNRVYLLNVKDIPENTIKTVERDIVCY
jgi:hypothetical protein